jgi:hypothetical protein
LFALAFMMLWACWIFKTMKIQCPVCGVDGILQQRGNSQRIQHYEGIVQGIRKYHYHSLPLPSTPLDVQKVAGPNPVRLTVRAENACNELFLNFSSGTVDFNVMVPPPFGFKSHRGPNRFKLKTNPDCVRMNLNGRLFLII